MNHEQLETIIKLAELAAHLADAAKHGAAFLLALMALLKQVHEMLD
jgi:hypothetical protein